MFISNNLTSIIFSKIEIISTSQLHEMPSIIKIIRLDIIKLIKRYLVIRTYIYRPS